MSLPTSPEALKAFMRDFPFEEYQKQLIESRKSLFDVGTIGSPTMSMRRRSSESETVFRWKDEKPATAPSDSESEKMDTDTPVNVVTFVLRQECTLDKRLLSFIDLLSLSEVLALTLYLSRMSAKNLI